MGCLVEQIKAGLRVSCGLDGDPIAAAAFGINLPTASILQMSNIDLCNLYLRERPPIRTGFGTLQLEFTIREPSRGGVSSHLPFFFFFFLLVQTPNFHTHTHKST